MKPPFLSRQRGSPFWFADFQVWDAAKGEWKRKQQSTKETDAGKALAIAQTCADIAHQAYMAATQGWSVPKALELANLILRKAGLPTSMANRLSFDEYRARWTASRAGDMKPASMKVRAGQFNVFAKWLGKRCTRPLDLLTETELQDFWSWMAQHYSGATPKNTLSFIKGVLAEAQHEGVIPSNPAALVKKRRARVTRSAEREPYSAAQITALLQQCASWERQGGTDWFTMVLIGLCTGARFSDCQVMGVRHVQAQGKALALKYQPIKTEGETSGPVTVPVVEPLLSHLRRLLPTLGPGDPFCPQLAGWSSKKLSDWFGKILDAAKIGGQETLEGRRYKWRALSFHSLRHTLPTWLHSAGVPESIIMKITGHRSVKIARGYTHVELQSIHAALNDGLARFTAGTKKPAGTMKSRRAVKNPTR